jgi:hypothetical protein
MRVGRIFTLWKDLMTNGPIALGSNGWVRLALIALVVVIVILALARRKRMTPPETSEEAPAEVDQAPAASNWAPPAQPAPPPPATGPSLTVGVTSLRSEANGLQVSWQAVNGGSMPLAVQWGAATIQVSGEFLELRYCYDAVEDSTQFEPPIMRTCGAGEVLSRSVAVGLPAIGRDPIGLSVTVVLGFGSAADHAVAQTGQDAYLSWQHTARSRPRPVSAAPNERS